MYTNNAYAIDGCATFFKRSRFSLVKKYEVEFNKAALSLAENIGPEQKKPALSRLLKVRTGCPICGRADALVCWAPVHTAGL